MLAVLGGHTDCVRFLLERASSPDAQDKRGSTALHRAVRINVGYGCCRASAAPLLDKTTTLLCCRAA